jgi:hypothetical protein
MIALFMNDFLVALENTRFGLFMRESDSLWGFPGILTTHAFAYCFLVATNMIVSLRILGFAKSIPLKSLRRLFSVMWFGLILTALTGVPLVIMLAEKRVPNPILWFKLLLIFVATPMMWKFQKKLFADPSTNENNMPAIARRLAAFQIALWLLIMIFGRLIPYSATIIGDGY